MSDFMEFWKIYALIIFIHGERVQESLFDAMFNKVTKACWMIPTISPASKHEWFDGVLKSQWLKFTSMEKKVQESLFEWEKW